MTGDAVARTTEQCELGEAARWDARRSELLRVDILAGRIYRDKIIEDGVMLPVQNYHVPGTVGAVAPVAGDEGWLLAAEQGFSYLRPDGELRPVADVAPAGTRMTMPPAIRKVGSGPARWPMINALAADHSIASIALATLN